MHRLVRNVIYLLLVLVWLQACNNYDEKLVTVTLYTANNSVESKLQINNVSAGQKHLIISLTNNGKKIDSIDSIEVLIKSSYVINENTKIMYGGTSMGRTPIKQSIASDSKSKSGTFLMIQHNENDYSLTGVLSWNTFLPYISYRVNKGIVIKALGEGKTIKPGETIEFEKIILSNNTSWQDIMFNYSREIAKEHSIKPKKPLYLKGWSTWDYYGKAFNTKDIVKNVDQLNSEEKDANFIQIDGGWWTARGDYLSVRKDIQGGMKAIADYVISKGYKAGIYLDGFRGEKNSELYRNHPEWFLKDQDGNTISREVNRGGKFIQYVYYDYSNPAVCEYMRTVLKTIRTDWGYSYFKIDFIRYGLLEEILADQVNDSAIGKERVIGVKAFNNNMTSVERTRAALKAMRDGIGNAYFLGSSSIFGPTFGIVDGLRTGGDISPNYEYYKTRSLQNAGNFYLNGTVVRNDADYLVVRNKDDEEPDRAWGKKKFGGNVTFDEAKMWSDYIALNGGVKISGDNLLTLRDDRKRLIKNSFEFETASRFIPLDLWDHAKEKNDAFNIMLAENDNGIYLSLFNWDDTDTDFRINGLQDTKVINTASKKNYELSNGVLQIKLKNHCSIILKVEGKSFDSLRKKIRRT